MFSFWFGLALDLVCIATTVLFCLPSAVLGYMAVFSLLAFVLAVSLCFFLRFVVRVASSNFKALLGFDFVWAHALRA